MPRSYTTRWTAEQVRHIGKLASEGHSGGEIAAQYGVTRNAIIGVCFRNKISLGGAGTREQKRRLNVSVLTLAQKRKEARQRVSVRMKVQVQNCTAPRCDTAPTGILVHELTTNTCRWPVHDTLPGRYCGEHTDFGSYCAHHHSRAYRGFE